MKTFAEAAVTALANDGSAPPIVREAMRRMADRFSRPAEPIMPKEQFDGLLKHQRDILTCNMPGCGDMVSTHGMLCVEHGKSMEQHRIPMSAREGTQESSDEASGRA